MVKEDPSIQVPDARGIDDQALRALAFVIRALRPKWDDAGIMAELTKAAQTHPLEDIARAAVDAATTASTSTPGGIGARLRGDGWNVELAPKTTDQPWKREAYYGPTMCTGCGEHGHQRATCPHAPRPADAARRQAAYAAAKGVMERRPQGHVPPRREAA